MTPESDLKLRITAYLNCTEPFWLRVNSGKVKVRGGFMQLAPEGTADIVVFRPTGTYWIELKAEGQKTAKAREEAQALFAYKVCAVGHRYAIIRSVEELIAYLNS